MSKRIYLDYAAAVPLDPEVKRVMDEVERKFWANPSSLHQEGREARGVIDNARADIAKILGCQTSNLVFTSGATESNVLAIRGTFEYARLKGNKPHLVVSKIEHASVKECVEQLQNLGLDVTWVGVDENGFVKQDELAEAVADNTVLVSVIYANNEIGVVQNISDLVKITRDKNPKTLFHTDAAQAAGWLEFSIKDLGVDLLSASSYKLGGPKGAGLLYFSNRVKFSPLFPGIQEWGIRAGTESTSLIAGMAHAWQLAQNWPREQIRGLRNDLIADIKNSVEGVRVNTDPERSVPHIAHFSFANIDSQLLTIALDRDGLATSPGSACSSGAVELSHVVEALGFDTSRYSGQLRLSLGIMTTQDELKRASELIKKVVVGLREKI